MDSKSFDDLAYKIDSDTDNEDISTTDSGVSVSNSFLIIRKRSMSRIKAIKPCNKSGMMYRKMGPFLNSTPLMKRRGRNSPISSPDITPIKPSGLGVAINRFTPSNRRSISSRLKLRCLNSPRFQMDYCNRSLLGTGSYGDVYKGIKRIEGIIYAIKVAKKMLGKQAGSSINREICAMATLGSGNENLVRYFCSWIEGDRTHIQLEYCNGGTLDDYLTALEPDVQEMPNWHLKQMLAEISSGLQYMHSKDLVHMDIKPDNIFRSFCDMVFVTTDLEESQDGMRENCIFKLGDFGHVVHINEKTSCESGDCRYVSKEKFHGTATDIKASDIFSLGLTALKCATLEDIPKNGHKWFDLRNNYEIKATSDAALNVVMTLMIAIDESERPTSVELSKIFQPEHRRRKDSLISMLSKEKTRNNQLEKELKEYKQQLLTCQNSLCHIA